MSTTPVTPERRQLAQRAQELYATGLTQIQVARQLGISRSYAQALTVGDPYGEKAAARKDSYRKPCPDCGQLMTGSDGPSTVPRRCADCEATYLHESRYWTADRIIERFKTFYAVVGRAPTAVDSMIFAPTIREKLSDERLADGEAAVALVKLPTPGLVQRELGSWANACFEAGIEQAPTGGAGHRGAPRPRRPREAPPRSHKNPVGLRRRRRPTRRLAGR